MLVDKSAGSPAHRAVHWFLVFLVYEHGPAERRTAPGRSWSPASAADLCVRLLDPSAARCPAARTSATFLGERPRSAPPVWWERGGLLERLRSDSGFSQERARPGSTAPRRLSLLSHQDSSISRFNRFPCGLCAYLTWKFSESWVKPVPSSRCRFSLALSAPGGGLDSEFILTVNIHCLQTPPGIRANLISK